MPHAVSSLFVRNETRSFLLLTRSKTRLLIYICGTFTTQPRPFMSVFRSKHHSTGGEANEADNVACQHISIWCQCQLAKETTTLMVLYAVKRTFCGISTQMAGRRWGTASLNYNGTGYSNIFLSTECCGICSPIYSDSLMAYYRSFEYITEDMFESVIIAVLLYVYSKSKRNNSQSMTTLNFVV